MTACHWDRDAEQYLADGEPCRTDDYGDPTRHCAARRTCSQHVGEGELTCARCLSRTRADIRQIVDRAALMLPEAIVAGVDSEAANLAGPAADVEAWSWRKVSAKQGRAWHVSLIEDDDDWHPETVLTRWAQMLTEDYRIDRPDRWDLGIAAALLERILGRVAQDDQQDFPQLRREMRKCRTHLESVMRDSQQPERGAPCPTCVGTGKADPRKVRLERQYSHWCTNPGCEQQFHSVTDVLDVWVCPRNSEHWWNAAAYADLMDERKGA